MREAIAGLTLRGRAFLVAGVAALVCAVLVGESALSRVGVLLAALPLITAWLVGRGRYKISLARTVTPQAVVAGQPARVLLTLTNEGRMPSGVLRLEDQLPYALGTRPRFVVERVEHGWRRQVDYQVRSEVRGRFEIGPLSVRVGDPFGLVELGRAFQTSVPLIVTPRTVPLAPIPLSGALAGNGDNRPRAFAGGSAEDVTVREYRRGDELRRVHWPSSARTGELMVRREEQDWQSRATIFLDNRAGAHRGQGSASSLEAAVIVAASVGVHLGRRGYTVRLVTATGEEPAAAWHLRDSEANIAALLETLALVQALPATGLDTSWLGEQGYGGLTVAVLGAVTALDTPVLRRVQHHAGLALAVALDVDAWGASGRGTGGAGGVLAQQGWRATTMLPQDRVDQVWHELGALSASKRTAQAGSTTTSAEVPAP